VALYHLKDFDRALQVALEGSLWDEAREMVGRERVESDYMRLFGGFIGVSDSRIHRCPFLPNTLICVFSSLQNRLCVPSNLPGWRIASSQQS
jgi:hypothetical protein